MDIKKAKKAVKMAEKAMEMMELEDAMEEMAKPDLQAADREITPMGRIGTVPPSTYSLGNMLDGTTTQSVINPET